MKVPCGGFDLDESVFNVDKNSKQIKLNSPISYDYMPEGYPSKSVETVTLMEEQEVAFSNIGPNMGAKTPPLGIEVGDKLTIIWDGVSYDVVVKKVMVKPNEVLAFGNLSLMGVGETTDYPFIYGEAGPDAPGGDPIWLTADTATSHTIKVIRQQETYTPIDANFIPNTIQRVGDDVIISSSTADSTKKFKITVDDSGVISATAVT